MTYFLLVGMPYFLGMSSFLVQHVVESPELAYNEKCKIQNNRKLYVVICCLVFKQEEFVSFSCQINKSVYIFL